MSTFERIEKALEGVEHEQLEARDGMVTLVVEPEALKKLMVALRDRCGFEVSTLVTAVDNYPLEPRYRVVYQFLSLQHSDRVRVHCYVNSSDAVVPSIAGLWPGASFSERECYDMFGIRFEGHGDLRRLLMPDGYGHHPLRKDFPHAGIEPDKLYREWDLKRRVQEGSQS